MKITRKEFLQFSGKLAAFSALASYSKLGLSLESRQDLVEEIANSAEVKNIFKYLEDNKKRHVELIQEYLRQPSVSSTGQGMLECADLLKHYLVELGASEATVVPTNGHPSVWGYFDYNKPKTIVSYLMYDTVPFDEREWSSPPLEARLVKKAPFERVVVAPGAINNKGYERAYLNALEAILAVSGSLPLNIMITADGEEELGSPNFPSFIKEYTPKLKKANAMLKPRPSQDLNGNVNMYMGYRGVATLELEASGEHWPFTPKKPVTGGDSPIVENAAWRMIDALNTVATNGGHNLLLEDYKEIPPLSDEDQMLISQLAKVWDSSVKKRDLAVEKWPLGSGGNELTGEALLKTLLFSPTMNISSFGSGFPGGDPVSLVPHKATAQFDARFAMGRKSNEVVPILSKHLSQNGYSDIQVNMHGSYEWSKTSAKEDVAQVAISMYEYYGMQPLIWPHVPYGSPEHLYTNPPLNLPAAQAALSHGGGMHSANEYLVIDGNDKVGGLLEFEKSAVLLLYLYANWS